MKYLLICLFTFCCMPVFAGKIIEQPESRTYLGTINPIYPTAPDSISNPYSIYGSPYNASGVNNPYGKYGNPFSNYSATNPWASNAPKAYDDEGNYVGRLTNNPYNSESINSPANRFRLFNKRLHIYGED